MATHYPNTCDKCGCALTSVYYDAKTSSGPWGNLCQLCWETYTPMKLGTGCGQQYTRISGAWKKTAG